MCAPSQFRAMLLLLCAACLLATGINAVSLRMMTASCGSRIPLDSLYPVESWWSLRDLMDWRNTSSTLGLTFGNTRDINSELLSAMERVSGMAGRHLTLFELDASQWWSTSASCSISWEPRDVLYVDTEVTAATVAVVPYSSELDCPVYVASFRRGLGADPTIVPVLPTTAVMLNITASVQQTTLYAEDTLWPVHLLVGPRCKAYVLLSVNREVSLEEWWTWIPATVYTAVVVPISLFSAITRKKVSASSFAFLLGTMFLGYLGSSIGLMVTLAGWQVSSGRLFPFPDAVTLYVCLWVGYAALMPLLLYRHPCRRMLFNAVVRSLIYGLFVAHVVAYWTLGFVAIASVGLAVVLVVNGVLIFLYAKFVALLATSKAMEDELRSMPMSWLAPISPFVPSVLLYADLFFVHHSPPAHALDHRLRAVVELFNVQSAIPFILLLESGAVALLVAATVRQPTFLVALFILLAMVVWHILWTLEQYAAAREHWKIDQEPGRRLLWPAIHALIDQHNVDVYKKNTLAAALPPGRQSAAERHGGSVAGGGRTIASVLSTSSAPAVAAAHPSTYHPHDVMPAIAGGSSRGSAAQYTPREGEQRPFPVDPQGAGQPTAVGNLHDVAASQQQFQPPHPGQGFRAYGEQHHLHDRAADHPPRHQRSPRSNSDAHQMSNGRAAVPDALPRRSYPQQNYGETSQQQQSLPPMDGLLPDDNYNLNGAMQRPHGDPARRQAPSTWQDGVGELSAGHIPYVDRSYSNY